MDSFNEVEQTCINISNCIKTELIGFEDKINNKNKMMNIETNQLIFSLPIVKQLIYSYELELKQKSGIPENTLNNTKLDNQEIQTMQNMINDLKIEIDEIKCYLKTFIKNNEKEENIQLKIMEIPLDVAVEHTVSDLNIEAKKENIDKTIYIYVKKEENKEEGKEEDDNGDD